ncbi:MAG: S9 family peptidase, partial [Saprospiraceae bacterium]|nr:S9 family peptidase [Saprospiraceae bacterium]
FHFLKDGKHYAELDETGLHIRSLLDETKDSLVGLPAELSLADVDQFEFSENEACLLLRSNSKSVYRHSSLATYSIYDFKRNRLMPLHESAEIQFATLSPDGSRAAFVLGNNVYIRDLVLNKTIQVTTDGKMNAIINGIPDWVYEEEFSPVDGDGMVACKWSPDGNQLGFLRFDETLVPTMPMTWYEGGMYPRQSSFKYPKVGQNNSFVTAHVFDLKTGAVATANTDPKADHYLPRINWTPDNRFVVMQLNRAQNDLQLLQMNSSTGAVTVLYQEKDPAYIELESENKLRFLKNGDYLWTSEKTGFLHIHRQNANSSADLTPVNADVTAFYGVNEKSGTFYYQTATPTPMDRQVWEGYLDSRPARLLTPESGTNDAGFTPDFSMFVHTRQDANTPPVAVLKDLNGTTLRKFVDNARVLKLRKEFDFVNKEFFQIPVTTTVNGQEQRIMLNAWAMKPANMEPGRKYPVLFDVYGGPGSQTVQNQYDGYMGSWHQLLVKKGYVVVSVDNRGTGARGSEFKKCTQMQLGKLETEDQIAAARYLATLPWVDGQRIGIWGWSFGGYLSTSCILKGNDVFKMAMAVAPVVNWKWYDSAYTERYMRTTSENLSGYDGNSPINFADRLRGDNYFIAHGVADDNVHWQQTVEMINALIKANKQFETYYYPNRNHGIYGDNATMHLFTKLTNFVLEKL